MDISDARKFLKDHHHGVLVARKKDGSLQMTLVSPVIDAAGNVIITARDSTYKVKISDAIRECHWWFTVKNLTVLTTSKSTARPRSSNIQRPWLSSSTGTGRSAVCRIIGTISETRPCPKAGLPFVSPSKRSVLRIEANQVQAALTTLVVESTSASSRAFDGLKRCALRAYTAVRCFKVRSRKRMQCEFLCLYFLYSVTAR